MSKGKDKDNEIIRTIRAVNEFGKDNKIEDQIEDVFEEEDMISADELNLDDFIIIEPEEIIYGDPNDTITTTTSSEVIYVDLDAEILDDDIEWVANELEKNEQEINTRQIPVEPKHQENVMYDIDFDKIKTVGDVCVLLKAINIRFGSSHENFEDFKHLLKKAP